MSVKIFDRLSVSTAGTYVTAGARRQLAPAIRTFLAQVGLQEPPVGATIPMAALDEAMQGASIERRMTAKEALARAGLIA